MRVIARRGWKAQVQCGECFSTLEIGAVDVRAWREHDHGGGNEGRIGVVCAVCRSEIRLDGRQGSAMVPSYVNRTAWEVYEQKPQEVKFGTAEYERFWNEQMTAQLGLASTSVETA